MKKFFLITVSILAGLLLMGAVVYYMQVRLPDPELDAAKHVEVTITEPGENHFRASNGSWLRKNDKQMWEMYLTGKPYELGHSFGSLAARLNAEKEAAFVGGIKTKVPSDTYLNFLKYAVGWFNRDLDEYIPEDYRMEIFGSSRFMSDDFDYITTKYQRALSYHGAHDIGHALQNMNLVGCTSFATWGEQSDNRQLLIGRNFDFYFGQDFAKDQIVAFYNPDRGYQFMSVTWACFSGVVSGMNEKGLTVTLNSAKSDIPSKGKTPVSLIAREILQYASNIDEAFAIAQKFDSFVAETFLIGSKADGKVGLIEKTPTSTQLYFSEKEEMIVTNHFQSDSLKNDPLNVEYVAEGVSTYRHERVAELLDSLGPMNAQKAAILLRDQRGQGGKNLGMGNEMAVNQLIAHHSVIFSPTDMMVWVSSPPYLLGDYLAYDLNAVFSRSGEEFTYQTETSISSDPFLESENFAGYEKWMVSKERIQNGLTSGNLPELSVQDVDNIVKLNPNSFLTYYYLGDYFLAKENWETAAGYLETGLNKDIARTSERRHMEAGLVRCREKMKP